MSLSRRSILRSGMTAAFVVASAKHLRALPEDRIRFAGVNLAGAEFGEKIPGMLARDYQYPSLRSINYFIGLGFNLIRLPFRWERLQPALGEAFAAAEERRLTALISYIEDRKCKIVLDPHNYARRKISSDGWNHEHLIGSPEVPIAAFADFWSRLAFLFRNNPDVIFGLMNEPYGLGARDWLNIVNPVIAGIRDRGARNLILVPGVAYTGAHSWKRAGNTVLSDVIDPARNYAIEVHQYLDSDFLRHASAGYFAGNRKRPYPRI